VKGGALTGFNVEAKGDWKDTEAWLKQMSQGSSIFAPLEKFGQAGVAALRAATPRESGETAEAWSYEVIQKSGSWSIVWKNDHVEDGRQIAVLLQYGHGTRTGGYVAPQPYINEALGPIFDQMANEGWKVVTRR
jgi:hypothetical protein